MSVLKSKRKASQFEVFHQLTKLRKDITDLLLRDFGYSYEKCDKKLQKAFGGRTYDQLTEAERLRYDRMKQKWEAFDDWFIYDQRQVIVDEKQFEDWYQSWFCNHYRVMSNQQRDNLNALYKELKEVNYHVHTETG